MYNKCSRQPYNYFHFDGKWLILKFKYSFEYYLVPYLVTSLKIFYTITFKFIRINQYSLLNFDKSFTREFLKRCINSDLIKSAHFSIAYTKTTYKQFWKKIMQFLWKMLHIILEQNSQSGKKVIARTKIIELWDG